MFHLSDLPQLLAQYADILPQPELSGIIKKFSLVTATKTTILGVFEAANRHQTCLAQNRIKAIDEDKNKLDAAVSCVISEIATFLTGCRSGNKDVDQIKKFCAKKAKSLHNQFPLENYHAVRQKLDLYDKLRHHNVLYIGRTCGTATINLNEAEEMFVLYYHETPSQTDSEQCLILTQTFFTLVKHPTAISGASKRFVFVDCELCGQTDHKGSGGNAIVHYRHGKPVSAFSHSEDDVPEKRIQFAKTCFTPEESMDSKEREDLALPHPDSSGTDRSPKGAFHSWKCFHCQRSLEYGSDAYFHCECGRSPSELCPLNCCQPKHKPDYVGFPPSIIQPQPNKIRPSKEINILILGETGVGKSTWINGFVNFITYPTLEEALKEPVYLIPAHFTMLDQNFQARTVTMGQSENESSEPGQSCTQMPRTYAFIKDDTIIRLIDTPGIGDPRGTEQDKKNFQFTLNHLTHYENLHGICILLKPNNARLTIMFQFCIKELLTHLHRTACENLVFVFTNARSTFYRPGDTYQSLHQLIQGIKGLHIPLEKDIIYCVDNEAVRFMAAHKTGILFSDNEKENFKTSWETSAAETNRLFEYIATKAPHRLRQTLSLNEARRKILTFTEPLAHITRNIQTNIQAADDKAVEIQQIQQSKDDLNGKLYVPNTELKSKPLNHPRTVCAGQKCIQMVGEKVNYITWCHEHCYLTEIVPNKYPQPGLQECQAMDSSGMTCSKCKCSWDNHMHITYELEEVQTQIVDSNIEQLLKQKDGTMKAVQAQLKKLHDHKVQLQKEMDEITKVASKFGYFLKTNAIIPYNDALEEYLRYLIKAEEEKIVIGASRKIWENYQTTLKSYRKEKRVLEQALCSGIPESQITISDVDDGIMSLFRLPVNGQLIRSLTEAKRIAEDQQVEHSETFYFPENQKRKDDLLPRNRLRAKDWCT